MASQSGYYRHPSIHGDQIAFVCEDDLWTVPTHGGLARRLTANPGTVSFPAYSPDGTHLAFTGRDDGPTEVYVTEAAGGPPRRLTWLGVTAQVVGWSADGRSVIFASDWRQPFMKSVHLWEVPAAGGDPRPLKVGPARAIAFEPSGKGIVIGRNSGDPARWKRYRGGTAGTLWIDRRGDGRFAPLVRLKGNLANPIWVGNRIFFLSDHEGHGNLYSCTPTGRGLRRHTDHEDFYVRYPSGDGRRIAYHAGADIFVYDPETEEERKVEIRIASPQSQRNRRFVSASRFFESFDLHPKGHSIASIHRGGLYTMGLWEGAPRRLGIPSGVRYRLARWLPDGDRIVAVTDERGEEELVVIPSDGVATTDGAGAGVRGPARKAAPRVRKEEETSTKRISGDFGRATDLAAAPSGRPRVALANQRQELILVDLESGRSSVVERSPYGRIAGIAWSADGRWLAYGLPNSNRTCRIHLYDSSKGGITPVTGPDFRDFNPSFDPDGRYLYFLSYRVFDPIYDSHYFDLGFPRGSRPYLIPLQKDLASPFSAAHRAPRAPGAQPPGNGNESERAGKSGDKEAKKRARPVSVEIDLDGIADRVLALPVGEGLYEQIMGSSSRILFSSHPIEGSLDDTWAPGGEPAARGAIQAYNLEENKLESVSDRASSFTLSMDGNVLGIRSGNRVRVVASGHKADSKSVSSEVGRESGWVDLDRLRVSVVPRDEWRQMFREAWRLQRDQFWTPDMSGSDWEEIHNRYLPLVDRVASRAEFSDLMWEMQGELGTSHCYELGGDYRPEPGWHQGFLGADLELDRRTGTWKVVRIPQGDPWDGKSASPLAAPGVGIREGDEILEVDGQPVNAEISPYQCLVHQAGREVWLRIRSRGASGPGGRRQRRGTRPSSGEVRVVAVTTLAGESLLRYRNWVESNRSWVHAASGGRVGYVHVVNMGPVGYAEFHRYYLAEVDRPGLIVDVRFNGGGHVSQLILEKLLRRRVGYDANRWGVPTPYPMDAPMGPMVALTNEYAGSDGDIFSHCFKLFGLGPLIGMRTWGGVVGIWPRHSLVDGSVTTQPEFAFWFQDVGWGVENYGTDPDIEVDIRPQDYAAGVDPQLARGLSEVEKIIRRVKPRVPDFTGRPSRRAPRLSRG